MQPALPGLGAAAPRIRGNRMEFSSDLLAQVLAK